MATAGGWTAKRFWKTAEVAPAEGGGFAVLLDGRPVRTPAKAPLVLPTRAAAEAVAAEWAAQEAVVDPRSMPVTRAANSAIDTVRPHHAAVIGTVAAYGASDLICYRAEAPEALVARQAAAWDPLLDWAEDVLGVRLVVTSGIVHAAQPPESLARLGATVASFDPFALAALHDLVALSGSLIIGLATAIGAAEPEMLWDLSRIDEDWQAEAWGVDAEAAEAAALKRAEFLQALRFLHLLRAEEAA